MIRSCLIFLIATSIANHPAALAAEVRGPATQTARACLYVMLKKYDDRSAPLSAVAGLITTKCRAEMLAMLEEIHINPTYAFDGGTQFRAAYINSPAFNFEIQQAILEARANLKRH